MSHFKPQNRNKFVQTRELIQQAMYLITLLRSIEKIFFTNITLRENQFVREHRRGEGVSWSMAGGRVWGVALWVSGVSCTFVGSWWCQRVGPARKLNGETEKCIIDQDDAKVSRSQHGIGFRHRVINPQSWIRAEELICTPPSLSLSASSFV